MKLLIVEDDSSQIELYKDTLESFNKESAVQIELKIKEGLADAKECLLSSDFDGAIVDLNLSSSTTDLEGLEIIKEIEKSHRFPIYIVSGNIERVSQEESKFFQKRKRDTDFKAIYAEFIEVYQTGITKILGRSGEIEKYLTTIFWNHLSNSLDSWINDDLRELGQKQKSLLRYTMAHMQEYIDGDVERYHPSELYITPPIKKNIHTGDIVEYENNRYVVLTPSCDIVRRENGDINTNFVLFCKISELSTIVDNFGELASSTSKNNNNRKRLNFYIENKKQNFHFIPKINSIDAGLISFQNTLTIEIIEVVRLLEDKTMVRVATISMPFLKDIISRYSNYFARQGSPDFETDEVYDLIFQESSTI